MEQWPEPRSCGCRYCREQFRQFVISRYPPGKRIPRFGFEQLDAIAPPPFDMAENRSPVRLAHGDIVWSENPHHARWTPDGRSARAVWPTSRASRLPWSRPMPR
jgi:hypothetical protein